MRSSKGIFQKSFCDQLILLLIGFFLLYAISGYLFSGLLLNQIFAFGLGGLSNGYIWTPLTYGLVHEGPLHLIVNILGIHFIGRPVETLLGRKQFRLFCLCSLLMGVVLWLPFNISYNQFLVGSSAIVLGSLCLFCLNRPNQPITLLLFFILPVTVKPKWVLWGTLGFEIYGLLNVELRGLGSVAHSAHLGGMFIGLMFFIRESGSIRFPFKIKFTKPIVSNTKNSKSHYRVNLSDKDTLKAETDRILDKINLHGFGSLTVSEKETLEKAKKLLEK